MDETTTPRIVARRTAPVARLALATALCWVPFPLWELLPQNPAAGDRSVPEDVPWIVTGILLCVLTFVAVWRGRSVPTVIGVVPLASGAAMATLVTVALLFGDPDPMAPLAYFVAIVATMALFPLVGAVAAFTMLGKDAARRRDQDGSASPRS